MITNETIKQTKITRTYSMELGVFEALVEAADQNQTTPSKMLNEVLKRYLHNWIDKPKATIERSV